MRIGMMADAYRPHVSGITHYISLNKRSLEKSGHQVFVFTFGGEDYADEESNIVRSPGLPLADTGYYFGLRYTRLARRKLQTMDIVHVHHPFLSGWMSLRYARPHGIPIVFTNHTRYDLYAHAYLPSVPEQLSTTFLQAFLPSFCRDVDLVIAPSQGLKQVLVQLGVDAPIETIPNGVDLVPFRTPTRVVGREELGLSETDTLLVYSGRLGPEKNLTFLMRAFAGVLAAYPDTSLLLLGDGPERENLQHLASQSGVEKQVVFCGMVPYRDLPCYLAAGDVFVTASVTEVHPLSVIEALASGLPVLGIDSPGIADTIVDGENGLLSTNDLAAFTAKLARLVADRKLRKKLAEGASRSADQYAIENTSAVVESQYERLVTERPRWRDRRWRMFWQRLMDRAT